MFWVLVNRSGEAICQSCFCPSSEMDSLQKKEFFLESKWFSFTVGMFSDRASSAGKELAFFQQKISEYCILNLLKQLMK